MAKARSVAEWFNLINKQQAVYQNYLKKAQDINNIYRGYKGNLDIYNSDATAFNQSVSSYNLLYSNTQMMMPILYNRTPVAECRAEKSFDRPARVASEVLETAINNSIKSYSFDSVIKSAVLDYLLGGTGLVRICYDPIFEKNEYGEEDKMYEEVKCEYLDWRNVTFGAAKKWCNVPWVAIKGLASKDEITEMFGASIANKLDYGEHSIHLQEQKYNNYDGNEERQETLKDTVEIYEIWDKDNKEVLFICSQLPEPLDRTEDPLKLECFYPIPEPLFSVTTNDSLIPIPLYVYYADLQEELEIISTRIRFLIKELKRRGVANGGIDNIDDIINARDNQFVPIANWNRFSEKGGIQAVIAEMDITRIAEVVQGLYQQRNEIKQTIYEITGLADIMRAQTDPRETLGAQKLKSNFGTLRISSMQREVQRFIKDIYSIIGEIISEHYSVQSVMLITNEPEEVVRLSLEKFLRNQTPRQVSIDIETDSTIEANEMEEQAKAVEFTSAISQLSPQLPEMAQTFGIDFTGELVTSVLRKFKLSRGLEQALEQQLNKLKEQQRQAEENPPPPPPDPDIVKAEMDMQKFQAELQFKQQQLQANTQIKVAELELKQQQLLVDANKTESDIEMNEFDKALDAAKLTLEQEKIKIEGANPNVNTVVGV